jgi:hypothetical protein
MLQSFIKTAVLVSLFLVIMLLVSLIRTVHRLEANELYRLQGSYGEVGYTGAGLVRMMEFEDKGVQRQANTEQDVPPVIIETSTTPPVLPLIPTASPVPPLKKPPILSIFSNIQYFAKHDINVPLPKPVNKDMSFFRQYGQLKALSDSAVRNIVVGLAHKTSEESFAILAGSLSVCSICNESLFVHISSSLTDAFVADVCEDCGLCCFCKFSGEPQIYGNCRSHQNSSCGV